MGKDTVAVAKLQAEARRLRDDFGWSVVAVREKKTVERWKGFQSRLPTDAELRLQFGRPGVTGLAVVCGPVSGGLHVRDFDRADGYDRWAAEHPALAKTLPTSRTARGFHVYHRGGPDRLLTLADGEYRGAGGYVLAPPSRHPDGPFYEWVVTPRHPVPEIGPKETGLISEREKRGGLTQEIGCFSGQGEGGDRGAAWEGEGLPGEVWRAIRGTLPGGYGQRHHRLFDLARALHGIAGVEQFGLRRIVAAWFKLALPNVRTKDFPVSWAEFRDGWGRVRWPKGAGLEEAIAEAKSGPWPAAAEGQQPNVGLLVAVCAVLQRRSGGEPFFLDNRGAGRVLGLSHVSAWKWLSRLAAQGILKAEAVGSYREGKASTWRFSGAQAE